MSVLAVLLVAVGLVAAGAKKEDVRVIVAMGVAGNAVVPDLGLNIGQALQDVNQ